MNGLNLVLGLSVSSWVWRIVCYLITMQYAVRNQNDFMWTCLHLFSILVCILREFSCLKNRCLFELVVLTVNFSRSETVGSYQWNLIKKSLILCAFLCFCRYPYMAVVLNFSQSWALYCLIQFYTVTKDELAHIKPLAKFLTFKSIVFLTWWQGVAIALLYSLGLFKSPIAQGLQFKSSVQDFIICIEVCLPSSSNIFWCFSSLSRFHVTCFHIHSYSITSYFSVVFKTLFLLPRFMNVINLIKILKLNKHLYSSSTDGNCFYCSPIRIPCKALRANGRVLFWGYFGPWRLLCWLSAGPWRDSGQWETHKVTATPARCWHQEWNDHQRKCPGCFCWWQWIRKFFLSYDVILKQPGQVDLFTIASYKKKE